MVFCYRQDSPSAQSRAWHYEVSSAYFRAWLPVWEMLIEIFAIKQVKEVKARFSSQLLSLLTLEFDLLEGNRAIPPHSVFQHSSVFPSTFSLLVSAKSELFHCERSILFLITIVYFGKMSQNKFSVKCYEFYMLFATEIENQLLDAICYWPKRNAFKFWLCVVLGGREKKMPDMWLLEDFPFACYLHWLCRFWGVLGWFACLFVLEMMSSLGNTKPLLYNVVCRLE